MWNIETHRAYQSGLFMWRNSYWKNFSDFAKKHGPGPSWVDDPPKTPKNFSGITTSVPNAVYFWQELVEQAWRERSVVWLAGVRRVGKTFLCQSLPNVEYFDCELPRTRRMTLTAVAVAATTAPNGVFGDQGQGADLHVMGAQGTPKVFDFRTREGTPDVDRCVARWSLDRIRPARAHLSGVIEWRRSGVPDAGERRRSQHASSLPC
jgi:hypothetical protein